jgi:hypothetical protein
MIYWKHENYCICLHLLLLYNRITHSRTALHNSICIALSAELRSLKFCAIVALINFVDYDTLISNYLFPTRKFPSKLYIRKYMHVETLALLTKPLLKYLK